MRESTSPKLWILSSQIALFSFLLFTARGIPIGESFRLIALIATQTFVGAEIWKRLVTNHQISSIEILGMGFAIGSAVFTVIDQILIHGGIRLSEIVIPIFSTILTVAAASKFKIQKLSITHIQVVSPFSIFLTLCVFLGFGELTYGALLAVLILVGLLLEQSIWVRSMWNGVIISTVGVCGAILLYFQFKPPIAYGSWFLRPLYTGTDDAVFSESVAYSVAHFGNSEYAAAQGSSLRYHWFSLAWSGMVERVTSVSPFTMTLHVVPIIAFTTIAALLIAIGIRLGMTGKFVFLAPTILFATSTAPGPIRFFYVLNTSNVLPFVWTLGLVLVVVLLSLSEIRFANHLIVFFMAVILLSKIPYVVAPLAGLVSFHLYSVIKDARTLKASLIQLAVIAVTLATIFITFLTPNEWEKRQFNIDWNLMHIAQGSNFRFIIAPVLILVLLITRFPLFLIFKSSLTNIGFKVFLFGACFTGLIRFVLNGSSAEFYFLNSSLIFGSIGIAIMVSDFASGEIRPLNRAFIVIGIVAAVSSFASVKLWIQFSAKDDLLRFEMIQITFPLFISCLIVLIVALYTVKSGLQLHTRILFLFMVVGLIFGSTGVFIAQSSQTSTYMSFGSIATQEDIDSLIWLRQNSNDDAIVATNRGICSGIGPCGFDESSFLISAVAHRRILLEGPRFVTGGRPYPEWVNERIQKSLAFANSPSYSSFSDLKNMGVSWYVIDSNYLSDSKLNSISTWEIWSSLEYHNENIYIFKLHT